MNSTESIWTRFSERQTYPALRDDVTVDVAVIGGGITGVTIGKCLENRGIKTAILESRQVGSGTTAHSTGNLYYTIDSNLSSLKKKYGIEEIKAVAESRSEAMQFIRYQVQNENLDCDLRKVPMYIYSSSEACAGYIQDEIKTAGEAGLNMSGTVGDDLPFHVKEILKIPDQAQINPMRYVQGLAKSLHMESSQIYEQTRVTSVEEKSRGYRLSTSGGTVTTDRVIHATHTPKGVKFVQTMIGPYREYGIACRVSNINHPEAIAWGYDNDEKIKSTRTYEREGQRYLIVVGGDHKVGHKTDNEKSLQELTDFAADHFDLQEVSFRWGGQHYRPADLLPYIGPRQKNSGEFIATGYSTDGLVYGTLAGMIISDIILDRENRWRNMYRATRKRPVKAASKFLKENVDVARHYLKETVSIPVDVVERLEKGEGTIIMHNGQKLAVSRNSAGELDVVSATCTHMGCIVNWNSMEQSWDCPCHGSRFSSEGEVIEGPAFHPLKKREGEGL